MAYWIPSPSASFPCGLCRKAFPTSNELFSHFCQSYFKANEFNKHQHQRATANSSLIPSIQRFLPVEQTPSPSTSASHGHGQDTAKNSVAQFQRRPQHALPNGFVSLPTAIQQPPRATMVHRPVFVMSPLASSATQSSGNPSSSPCLTRPSSALMHNRLLFPIMPQVPRSLSAPSTLPPTAAWKIQAGPSTSTTSKRAENVSEAMMTMKSISVNFPAPAKGKTPFPCKQCCTYFPTADELKRHEWIHSMKFVQCSKCGQVFPNKEEFMKHSESQEKPEMKKESEALKVEPQKEIPDLNRIIPPIKTSSPNAWNYSKRRVLSTECLKSVRPPKEEGAKIVSETIVRTRDEIRSRKSVSSSLSPLRSEDEEMHDENEEIPSEPRRSVRIASKPTRLSNDDDFVRSFSSDSEVDDHSETTMKDSDDEFSITNPETFLPAKFKPRKKRVRGSIKKRRLTVVVQNRTKSALNIRDRNSELKDQLHRFQQQTDYQRETIIQLRKELKVERLKKTKSFR